MQKVHHLFALKNSKILKKMQKLWGSNWRFTQKNFGFWVWVWVYIPNPYPKPKNFLYPNPYPYPYPKPKNFLYPNPYPYPKPKKILYPYPKLASSAYIERFFCISGIIYDQKRMMMEDDLIIHRSILKANMKFLDVLASFNLFMQFPWFAYVSSWIRSYYDVLCLVNYDVFFFFWRAAGQPKNS